MRYQENNKFVKGNEYNYSDITDYAYNVNVELFEIGSQNYSSGHNFIKLVETKTNKTISFVLNKNYNFECVYNDFN
jgi:hypothetical protein